MSNGAHNRPARAGAGRTPKTRAARVPTGLADRVSTPSVIDLDAVDAQRQEANEAPTEIHWRDDVYTVPPAIDWPLEFTDNIADGHLAAALEILLGAAQWLRMREEKPTLAHLSAICESLGVDAGIGGMGESQASDES
jgi:hypothetical protein